MSTLLNPQRTVRPPSNRSHIVGIALVAGATWLAACASVGVRKFEVPGIAATPGSELATGVLHQDVANHGGTATAGALAAARPAAAPAAPPKPESCDVWLDMMYGKQIQSPGVCIKKTGAPFAFPSPIYLEGTENGPTDTQFNGMCLDEKEIGNTALPTPAPAAEAKAAPSVETHACAWSHLYRDSHPLTFKIRTNGESLSHFAHVIRVFRNGKLVFSWKDDNVLASLAIPGAIIAANLMPYGAPMDLRIIPAGSPDDPSVDTHVTQTVDPLISRLEIVKGVLLGPKGPTPALMPEIACVSWMVSKAQAAAYQILGKTAPSEPGPQPDNCNPPKDGQAASLHDQIVAAVKGGTQAANQDIDSAITALGAEFGASIATEAEKAKASLIKKGEAHGLPNGLTVSKTVEQINELAGQGAQIFDSVSASVRGILADVKQLTKDRDEQAREFAAVTDALAENGSVFEPFTKNPALVDGETSLDMHYGDRFQIFFLAPWNGLSIRVTRNVGTSLGLENAIPILDLTGFRYQWGTGRSQSFRMGWGFMYFKDEATVMPLATTPVGTTMTTESVFNVATESSVSWFGFNAGVGYVLNDRDFGGFWARDRIRVIVGADLLKLFGNKSAELASF
jgi:hypothetical protein